MIHLIFLLFPVCSLLYALECAVHWFAIVCAITDTTKCRLCTTHNQTRNANPRENPFYSWINRTSLCPPYLSVQLSTFEVIFLLIFFAPHFIFAWTTNIRYKSCIKYYIISAWIASGKSSIHYIYHICTLRCQSFYCFRTFWQIGWMVKVAFVLKIRNEVLWNNCVIITHSVVGSLALPLPPFSPSRMVCEFLWFRNLILIGASHTQNQMICSACY